MSTPLFLLLGLTIATCVIAYWSDNLGKKLGKKRVSLFGLRPRQTASLMTMTSSVVIMLFTLGVLLATNSGLRNALLRYDKERADNRDLREKNSNLRSEQKGLQMEVSSARKQASDAKKQATDAKKQAQDAHQKYDEAQGELVERQKQLRVAKMAEQRAQSGEKQARNGEQQARKRSEQARIELVAKQKELGKVNRNLEIAQLDLGKLQTRLQQAQEKVKQAQNRLAQEQNKVAMQQDNFSKVAAASLKFQDDLFRQINVRQQEIENLKAQKVGLDRDVKLLNDDIERLNKLQIQLAQPSRGDIDVPEGAVYAERLIQPRSNVSETMDKLGAMLKEAREEAAKDNEKRTIKLLLKTGEELPQDLVMKSLAQFLQGFNAPASVRLSALRNHAKTETEIQCAFLVVQSRLAFARDEVMASKVIDGSQSDARIFNQLLHDLLDAGEIEANKQGVVPILKRGQKLYADGTNERLFEALRSIQAIGKPVEVRLLADDNLTTIDQLRVHFQVGTPTGKADSNKPVSSSGSL